MNLERYFKRIREVSKGKFLIGLTGQVGTGKSTILSLFKEKGAFVISTDEIASKVLTNKKCYSKILLEFKEAVNSNGEIDKKKLAEIIFQDSLKRKCLENLLHPLIIKEIIPLVKQTNKKIIVVEVPLLYETGFHKYVDLTVCAYLDKIRQIKRLKKRGWSEKEILNRINSQFSMEEKSEMSDIVIDNRGNLDYLKDQVFGLYNFLYLIKK